MPHDSFLPVAPPEPIPPGVAAPPFLTPTDWAPKVHRFEINPPVGGQTGVGEIYVAGPAVIRLGALYAVGGAVISGPTSPGPNTGGHLYLVATPKGYRYANTQQS